MVSHLTNYSTAVPVLCPGSPQEVAAAAGAPLSPPPASASAPAPAPAPATRGRNAAFSEASVAAAASAVGAAAEVAAASSSSASSSSASSSSAGGGWSGRNVALALGGEGFLAFSVHAAVTSGLLAAQAHEGGAAPIDIGGLFRRFGTISSVSGGSWYISQLAYSRTFRALVEEMAAQPGAAGSLFRRGCVDGWLGMGQDSSPFVKVLQAFAGTVVEGEAPANSLREIGYFLEADLSWTQFVERLLCTSAGIPCSRRLGDEVETWAVGKVWMLGHSLVLPTSAEDMITIMKAGHVRVESFLAYLPSAAASLPRKFVPARISVTLGAGTHSDSPVPYSAASALPTQTRLSYRCKTRRCCLPARFTATSELGSFSSFEVGAGWFPLVDVVAASSAFLGAIFVGGREGDLDAGLRLGLMERVVERLRVQGDWAVWACSATHGGAFSQARAMRETLLDARHVSRQSLEDVAAVGMRSVVDGSLTDATGVAHAVASGATEVLTILLTSATSEVPPALLRLFGGYRSGGGGEGGEGDEGGEGGGGGGGGRSASVDEEDSRIFDDEGEDVRARLGDAAHFPRLAPPAGCRILRGLAVGSLAARTRPNVLLGVAADRKVTLHIVSVAVRPPRLVDLNGFLEYVVLAQEIVETLGGEAAAANAALVRDRLLSKILG